MVALEQAGKYIQDKINEIEEKDKLFEHTIKSREDKINNLNKSHNQQLSVYKKVIIDLQQAYEYQKDLCTKLEALEQFEQFGEIDFKMPSEDVSHIEVQTDSVEDVILEGKQWSNYIL